MSSFRFYHPIEIRYSDLDPQKHVNNARYLTYFEQARIAYIRQLGLWDFRSFMDIGFILASAELTFLVPVELGWSVEAGVRVSRLGTKSLTMLLSARRYPRPPAALYRLIRPRGV